MTRVIRSDKGAFMKRWPFLPENRLLNICLNYKFANDPNDIYLHDHPYWNVSIILRGAYWEYLNKRPINALQGSSEVALRNYMSAYLYGDGARLYYRMPGQIAFRRAAWAHQIKIDKPTWSIWITGPVRRRWGFYLPEGWVHWRKYVSIMRRKA